MATSRRHGLTFLDLPPEIRLQIYYNLIPLEFDSCNPPPSVANALSLYVPRHTSNNISPILRQSLTLDLITRSLGLSLLLTCRVVQREFAHLLSQHNTTFHCPGCFEVFLKHFTFNFGIDMLFSWMLNVRIILDTNEFARPHQTRVWEERGMTREVMSSIVREETWTARETLGTYQAGCLDREAGAGGFIKRENWLYWPLAKKDKCDVGEIEHPTTKASYLDGMTSSSTLPWGRRYVIPVSQCPTAWMIAGRGRSDMNHDATPYLTRLG